MNLYLGMRVQVRRPHKQAGRVGIIVERHKDKWAYYSWYRVKLDTGGHCWLAKELITVKEPHK